VPPVYGTNVCSGSISPGAAAPANVCCTSVTGHVGGLKVLHRFHFPEHPEARTILKEADPQNLLEYSNVVRCLVLVKLDSWCRPVLESNERPPHEEAMLQVLQSTERQLASVSSATMYTSTSVLLSEQGGIEVKALVPETGRAGNVGVRHV
jgi:hypothetical protein